MNRVRLLLIIGIAFVILGLFVPSRPLVLLSLPCLIFSVFLAVVPRGTTEIRVSREISHRRMFGGNSGTVTVSVEHIGGQAATVLLEDTVPPGVEVTKGSSRCSTHLAQGGRFSWSYSITAARGRFRFDSVAVEAVNAAGITTLRERLSAPAELTVVPEREARAAFPFRPNRTLLHTGPIPSGSTGPGTDFYEVRQYRIGDSLRRVNWKRSARDQLGFYTNEFEHERIASVEIIVDGRITSNGEPGPNGGNELFEHSLRAAASISSEFLAAGHRVGLLLYGGALDWTIPAYGKVQAEKIHTAIAGAKLSESDVFRDLKHLPTRLLPARSLVLVISPLLPGDLESLVRLHVHQYSVMLLSPDASTAGDPPHGMEAVVAHRIWLLERGLLFRELERRGIPTVSWDVSKTLAATLAKERPRLVAWTRRNAWH